jgi:hypothetical protein
MATVAVTKITVSSTDVRLRAAVSVVDPIIEVSRSIPVPEISYIYLQVLASLDSTGLFKFVTDSAVVSDGESFSLSKALIDSVPMSDSIATQYSKPLSDALTMSDVFSKILIIIRSFSETQVVDDVFTKAFAKFVNESVTPTDVVSKSFSKSLQDGFAMNDSSEATDGITFAFAHAVQNIVTASDASIRGFTKTRTDSVSTSDSGILVQQDYVDLTYFAEDYVGVSYVF